MFSMEKSLQKTRILQWNSRRSIRQNNMTVWRTTLTPVYPLAFGLTNHAVQKAVRQALASDELLKEYLPEELLQKYDLIPYAKAIRQIHFPDDMTHLIVARRRLVFDEFFLFVLNMRKRKEITQKEENPFTLGR